jgi:hypothetical protein
MPLAYSGAYATVRGAWDVNSGERAEQLGGQLQQWAMEAIERPRDGRECFIRKVAGQYYEDAIRNGLTQSQAEAWRESVKEWLNDLVAVIETSGGGTGGNG